MMKGAAVSTAHRLVILYGMGGLSDCGRHAIQAALEQKNNYKNKNDGPKIDTITVLTPYPELLKEENWNCGCTTPHKFTEEEQKQFHLVPVKDWNDETLLSYFQNATAVISCLGNRQPTFMGVKPDSWCSYEGNSMVIRAMKLHTVPRRVVVLSSFGINDDWPPMEFHWAGKIMSLLFLCCARKAYHDLSSMEYAYEKEKAKIDYLIVRPVGIGEEVIPSNEWHIQTEKYKDSNLLGNMAKLDVARYMIQEALQPTRHNEAIVLGGVKPPPEEEEEEETEESSTKKTK